MYLSSYYSLLAIICVQVNIDCQCHTCIQKGELKYKASNYKLISLISLAVKTLESIICTNLLTFLIDHNQQQHSFISRKSFWQICWKLLRNGFLPWIMAMVLILYTWNQWIIAKLSFSPLTKFKARSIEAITLWLTNFLCNHFQRVALNRFRPGSSHFASRTWCCTWRKRP